MLGQHDLILAFLDPLISRKRLKLETSNLARRRTAVSLTKKPKIRSNGVMLESRDTLVKFWDPPYTSRLVEARNFKFGTVTNGVSSNAKKCKIRSKGVMWGHVHHFWNFGILYYLGNG